MLKVYRVYYMLDTHDQLDVLDLSAYIKWH